MLGISYGELFLLLGATAAIIGPKDLPVIARTAGRLAGRAIGYVQLARGQLESVLQQSQANQVHKELKDTIAQLEAIRYEIRSISIMNPGPMTRSLMENSSEDTPGSNSASYINGNTLAEKHDGEQRSMNSISKSYTSTDLVSGDLHSRATAYARLAETAAAKTVSLKSGENEGGLFTVLPVSAESAGFLPNQQDDVKGSDIVLEAILEAEVAHNAKDFFVHHQNQIKSE